MGRARQVCHTPGCTDPAVPGSTACRRHARIRGRAWLDLAARVIALYEGRCSRCPAPATSVHHRIPIELGGAPLPRVEDLEPVCDDCRPFADAEALASVWKGSP